MKKGVLAFLDPLPRFEVGQPGNVLRVFERGQQKPLEIGVPIARTSRRASPANRLSQRGLGTLNRTDPVWLNLQKTRLFDPALSLLGNNEHPGEFRSSGCTGCHVIYANDRSPVHSVRVRPVRQSGLDGHRPIRRFPRTSRAIRSGTSSRTRSRRASAWSATTIPARP